MKSILASLLLLFIIDAAKAQNFKNEFGFKTENDAYLATLNDRYYTNGLFIYYRSAINHEKFGENIEKKT